MDLLDTSFDYDSSASSSHLFQPLVSSKFIVPYEADEHASANKSGEHEALDLFLTVPEITAHDQEKDNAMDQEAIAQVIPACINLTPPTPQPSPSAARQRPSRNFAPRAPSPLKHSSMIAFDDEDEEVEGSSGESQDESAQSVVPARPSKRTSEGLALPDCLTPLTATRHQSLPALISLIGNESLTSGDTSNVSTFDALDLGGLSLIEDEGGSFLLAADESLLADAASASHRTTDLRAPNAAAIDACLNTRIGNEQVDDADTLLNASTASLAACRFTEDQTMNKTISPSNSDSSLDMDKLVKAETSYSVILGDTKPPTALYDMIGTLTKDMLDMLGSSLSRGDFRTIPASNTSSSQFIRKPSHPSAQEPPLISFDDEDALSTNILPSELRTPRASKRFTPHSHSVLSAVRAPPVAFDLLEDDVEDARPAGHSRHCSTGELASSSSSVSARIAPRSSIARAGDAPNLWKKSRPSLLPPLSRSSSTSTLGQKPRARPSMIDSTSASRPVSTSPTMSRPRASIAGPRPSIRPFPSSSANQNIAPSRVTALSRPPTSPIKSPRKDSTQQKLDKARQERMQRSASASSSSSSSTGALTGSASARSGLMRSGGSLADVLNQTRESKIGGLKEKMKFVPRVPLPSTSSRRQSAIPERNEARTAGLSRSVGPALEAKQRLGGSATGSTTGMTRSNSTSRIAAGRQSLATSGSGLGMARESGIGRKVGTGVSVGRTVLGSRQA